MEATQNIQDFPEARQRRLELARQTLKKSYAQCIWSWHGTPEITEDTIPLIVRSLRINAGAKGCQPATELCRQVNLSAVSSD